MSPTPKMPDGRIAQVKKGKILIGILQIGLGVADDACGTRVYKAPGSGILRDLDSGLGTFHINIVHDMIWGIELGTCSVDHHVGSRVEENSAHRIRICKISYIIPRSEHS
ncbi:hypothetical protein ABEW05_000287 [Botrytis cinerea]